VIFALLLATYLLSQVRQPVGMPDPTQPARG
jgi:hypothetical protein